MSVSTDIAVAEVRRGHGRRSGGWSMLPAGGLVDGRWRSPWMAAVCAPIGLLLDCIGYLHAYSSTGILAQTLYWCGLVVIFLPCAVVLSARQTSRREALAVSVLLGELLVLSLHFSTPNFFGYYDELLHQSTLWRLASLHTVHVHNTGLPISPSYPGLELFTLGIGRITGTSMFAAQLVTVMLARAGLFALLYLVGERVTGSSRAGGLAVIAFCSCPQTYVFLGIFAYETLGFTVALAAVYSLLLAVDRGVRHPRLAYAATPVFLLVLTVTHHLTSWLTAVALATWAVALWAGGRRHQAARVATMALLASVLCVAWTALIGPSTVWDYLSPIFRSTFSQLAAVLEGTQPHRTFFHDAAGNTTALWEQVVSLASVAVWCGFLVLPVVATVRRRFLLRGRWQGAVVVAVAATYPLLLLPRLAGADGGQISDRASTFVYLPMVVAAGGWLVHRGRRVPQLLTVGLLALVFLGGDVLGSGPDWSHLPGPYIVGAAQRSITASSVAAARWAGANLPPGSTVGADAVNEEMMDAVGHLTPITTLSGAPSLAPLFYSATVTNADRAIVRAAHMQYLVVDLRLSEGPPQVSDQYFDDSGSNASPPVLTRGELEKFAAAPGFRPVYDNGDLRIYDVTAVSGEGLGGLPRRVNGGFPQVWWLEAAVAVLGILGIRRLLVADLGDGMAVFVAAIASLVALVVGLGTVYWPRAGVVAGVAIVLVGGLALLRMRPSPRRRAVSLRALVLPVLVVGMACSVGGMAVDRSWAPAPTSLAFDPGARGGGTLVVHPEDQFGADAQLWWCDGRPNSGAPTPATAGCQSETRDPYGAVRAPRGAQWAVLTGGRQWREVQIKS